MPLIGSPEDEHACRRQDSRSGARAGIPALLLLSFSLVFNQDEKPGDHERLTKSSFAPIQHCPECRVSDSLYNC